MATKKARWQQRFENFDKAYLRFAEAVGWDTDGNDVLTAMGGEDAPKELMVKRFELAFELARNLLRDYLDADGDRPTTNKDVIRHAFKRGYIREGEVWMQALEKRNEAVHIYKEEIMLDVFHFAREKFFPVLRDMRSYFKQEYDECDSD